MAYKLFRNLLFQLSPEVAHEASLDLISATERLGLLKRFIKSPLSEPTEVMGVSFPNPVGLAAGLDKNGDHIDGLAALGFGSIEIGTVTPRPQAGNPKPRLFRVTERDGIINRMGFNNDGLDAFVSRIKHGKRPNNIILGGNIGKNKNTPDENAKDDYIYCMRKVYNFATYITINISSPNTPGLRSLQYGDALNELLSALKIEQKALATQYDKYVPIAVKIAPDLNEDEIKSIANCLIDNDIDGVIATNTTLSREGVEGLEHGEEQGGLSGEPVKDKSTVVIKLLSEALAGKLPIIGVGGIASGKDAQEKIAAGASLVQVYSGFIYQGPDLVKDVVSAL